MWISQRAMRLTRLLASLTALTVAACTSNDTLPLGPEGDQAQLQSFYVSQGARACESPDPELFAREPHDIHMLCPTE